MSKKPEAFPAYLKPEFKKEDRLLPIVGEIRAADVLLKHYRLECQKLKNRLAYVELICRLDTAKLTDRIADLESELEAMRVLDE